MIHHIHHIIIPVVPARGGAEVALKIYIRPFSSIELACAVRQPSPCVRALCESCVLLHMSHVTTSLPHHFPSSAIPSLLTSLPHHFPSPPLPFLTTSHRHHFPSSPLPFTTSLRHHFPSSPLPFLTTSHRRHFPPSPLPFLTTPLHHHFPSSPLP